MVRHLVFCCLLLSALTFALPAVAQTEDASSGDRFADTLDELQRRMAALENRNAKLEAELALQSDSKSHLGEDSSIAGLDESPDSFEALLKSSQESDERLTKLEERLKKDADAAKKKRRKTQRRKRSGSKNIRSVDMPSSASTMSWTAMGSRSRRLWETPL